MSVVAIGNFDGLHLGHQTLLQKTVQLAESLAETSVAYTFTPHPRKSLRLMSDAQKAAGIRALGITQVIFQAFTPEFAALTPSQFIVQVLVQQLKASQVVIGPDFTFGSGAQGNAATLQQDSRFVTKIVDPVWVDGELCSSSLIRQVVMQGDLEKAKRLLGQPFSLSGKVVKGSGRGRQLGIPTANLSAEQEVLPPLGVYAAYANHLGKAVVNIGRRPTFNSQDTVHVEAYFLDFQGDLYDQEIEIFLERKIRDEKKFDSIEELKEQIKCDIGQALQVTTPFI